MASMKFGSEPTCLQFLDSLPQGKNDLSHSLATAGNLGGATAGSHRRVLRVVRSGAVVISNVLKDICKNPGDLWQHRLVLGASSL